MQISELRNDNQLKTVAYLGMDSDLTFLFQEIELSCFFYFLDIKIEEVGRPLMLNRCSEA